MVLSMEISSLIGSIIGVLFCIIVGGIVGLCIKAKNSPSDIRVRIPALLNRILLFSIRLFFWAIIIGAFIIIFSAVLLTQL